MAPYPFIVNGRLKSPDNVPATGKGLGSSGDRDRRVRLLVIVVAQEVVVIELLVQGGRRQLMRPEAQLCRLYGERLRRRFGAGSWHAASRLTSERRSAAITARC